MINRLVVRLKIAAAKNLGKAFFALFIMVILESLVSGVFAGPALYFMNMENPSIGSKILSFSLLGAGVFFWYLFQCGFAVMLLRMVRNEYVTVGYLFYGIRKLKLFAPVAFINMFLTALPALVLRGALVLLKSGFPEYMEALNVWIAAHEGTAFEYADILILAGIIVVFVILLLFGFLFMTQFRYDNPQISILRTVKLSFKTAWSNFFRIIALALRGAGRNLVLAVFYFALTIYFSGNEESTFVRLFSMIFDFLYFINIYKAIVIVLFSLPVLYDDAIQPKIDIIVSLKKTDSAVNVDEVVDDEKNQD